MAYIPPDGNDANFELIVYIAPAGNEANFNLTGTEASTRDSEVIGKEAVSSERDSELTGTGTPSERDSEVAGKLLIGDEINSEVIGKAFLRIPRNYRIIVRDENDSVIGEIKTYRNLNFGKRLNNYGTASFEIPVTDLEDNNLISLRKYTVWIYYQKDANTTLVWAGEQAARESNLDDAGNNWATIHCYTWLEQLNSRYTRLVREFDNIDAGEIAWTLIDETQRQLRDYILGLGPEFPIDNTDILEIDLPDPQDWGMLDTVPAYQSFIAPSTGKLNKVFILGDEDDPPVIGDRVISIYTDNGSDAPNTQISGSQITQTIVDDGLAQMHWMTFDYSELNVNLTAGTKYWLRIGWNDAVGNVGRPTWRFTTGYITGRVEVPGDPDMEAELVGYDLACRFEMIGNNTTDASNGDLGITEGTIEATMDRDRTYYNQNIMEAIINLANVISGFDFDITDERVFNVYAVKGEDKTDEVVFEYGRNIKAAKVFEDFSSPVNRAIVLGQSTDNNYTLMRVERDDTGLQTLYKVREGLLSEMDVSETTTMEEKGDALIRKYGNTLVKIDVDIASVLEPNITQFALGDSITLIIKNGIHDISEEFRVFEWEISFDSNNVEKLTLVLGNFTYE